MDNKYSQSPKSHPRHSCKNPGMQFRREIPKQNMGAHTNSFIWEWAELAIVTRMQEPRGQALQVSLVPPGLRPRPLSPPYPTLLSSPSSPAGGHITHNGGDCPGGAHGPWRHGKDTHPKKRNAWQAFRAHNPPHMQCTFLLKCKQSAVHFSENCKKMQKKCKVFALQMCKKPHEMQQVHVDKQLVQQKCKQSAINVQKNAEKVQLKCRKSADEVQIKCRKSAK